MGVIYDGIYEHEVARDHRRDDVEIPDQDEN